MLLALLAGCTNQQYPQQINQLCKMSLHPEHQVAPDATPLGLERAALVIGITTWSHHSVTTSEVTDEMWVLSGLYVVITWVSLQTSDSGSGCRVLADVGIE